MTRVPRLWPASTVVCLGTGPSLTQADVDVCRDLPVIAVSDAVRLAPWAQVLYSCDRKWWRAHPETATFSGLKYGLEALSERPDVQILDHTGDHGLELDPTALRTGKNSGYQAINLAVHLGAARILLLGYDLQWRKGRSHFFGRHPFAHPDQPPFTYFKQCFQTLVEPLATLKIEVINCTPDSALTCFPRRALRDALPVAA